ncbi:hypothetical protein PF003_g1794 [Phytophthora fragariae]|nr:hypothetical protein PF003_g1794 [Phytophthora fragariae]
MLPKLAIRVLSIAVNTATCERLFSELGLILTAKRNKLNSSKALDYHIIAKHVRQRLRKEAVKFENPKKKLLISPNERNIIFDAASSSTFFTPSPQLHVGVSEDADSDDEDPGDGVDGPPTFALWGEYLREVFEDDEIEAHYTDSGGDATYAAVRVSGAVQDARVSSEIGADDGNGNEFEEIAEAVRQTFTDDNDQRFPQEAVKLQGFGGQKATLAKLFG